MANNINQDIINLVEKTEDLRELREALNFYHPLDLAECFTSLNEEDREKLYAVFTNEELANIFSYLDTPNTIEVVEDINVEKLASIISEMEPDDAADLINEFDEEKAESILKFLEDDDRIDIQKLIDYDEDSAGAIMNSNYIEIKSGSDVKDLMKVIVTEAPDAETINTSFIIDNDGKLLGTLDLKKVIVTKSPCLVDSIMNDKFIAVNANEKIEDVIRIIKNYDIYDLPVLDNGILKGIITMDDALEAIVDEADEDYAKLAGLTTSEEHYESTLESVKKRLPWLSLLLILNIFVSIVISSFDYLFEILTVLVIFQPIILGLAGNCGTQSLAITIRKIAQDELSQKSYVIKHLLKEITLGLGTGIILGILSFLFSSLLLYIRKDFDQNVIQVGFVVGLSIFVSLTMANLFGSLVPILLYKLKIDPAVASGPFITTLNDILAIAVYFSLATFMIFNQLG